jgi:hypothetical protein
VIPKIKVKGKFQVYFREALFHSILNELNQGNLTTLRVRIILVSLKTTDLK